MNDIVDALEHWRERGDAVAIATVVKVERSAPRPPGSSMAVNSRGEVAGSVSGGCVESAVYQEAQDAIATGQPRFLTYGITDDEAIERGLTCGGILHVFVERMDW